MKKLFISQPMKGKSDADILAERQKAIKSAEEKIGEPVEVIDSFFQEAPVDAKPLQIADENNCPQLGGEATTFSFSFAIKYLRRGFKVARKGWNGKKQYIQLATGISYKTADGDIVNCEHDAIGNMAIAFCGTSGVQMGWLASQADMLADDWMFVDEENNDSSKY